QRVAFLLTGMPTQFMTVLHTNMYDKRRPCRERNLSCSENAKRNVVLKKSAKKMRAVLKKSQNEVWSFSPSRLGLFSFG
ncbi:MAG: hypothetical protein LHW45_10435, partial [Candidatus Cloacimonetes bacterium]|nr:hypothetical protein [Candidatus Cloacimonadota bacterium]MDY0368027.1 hypothetical protein [Candidatus Syntrophosphaera sp.]